MRICVVSGTFHPEAGGPPTFLFHLLPELVLRGHQVRVVAFGEPAAQHTYPYAVQQTPTATPPKRGRPRVRFSLPADPPAQKPGTTQEVFCTPRQRLHR